MRELSGEEQIEEFKEFLEKEYLEKIAEAISKGEKRIEISFVDLAGYNPNLANLLLETPEEILIAGEEAIKQLDVGGKELRIRIKDLPQSQRLMISDIRSKHIDKLIQFTGIIKQKSDVRPQVTKARFECPSCGNIMEVLQLGEKFREPSRCSCGRKGGFRLLSKELVDVQRIVVEESPEELEGGQQPKRIGVFLREDLVSPLNEKRTNPGSKIDVVGVVKEIQIPLRTGGKSTKFDLMVEANNIIPIEESFTELKIDPEEEAEI